MADRPTINENLRLAETIRLLEARIAQLEKVLAVQGAECTLKVGASSITIKPMSIDLRAKDVTIVASGKVEIKASSDIIMKGPKISQN